MLWKFCLHVHIGIYTNYLTNSRQPLELFLYTWRARCIPKLTSKNCPTFTGLSDYLVCAFAECMHLKLISIISSMLIAGCRNRMPKSLEVTVVAAYYYSYYAVCKINSMFSVTGGKQHWRRPLRYWLGMIARFAADWIMRLDVNQKCSRIPEFQMP